MRNLFAFLVCWMVVGSASAQKHDYKWITGYRAYNNFVGYDSSQGYIFGQSFIDFNQSQPTVTYDSLKMSFSSANTSISDTGGALLFYTNGVYVANKLDEIVENSDSLNYGFYRDNFSAATKWLGYNSPQGIIAIPSVSNTICFIR